MNFNQLEFLKELYKNGNFTLAAQKLGVTQPALSLQIQKLEEELDFKLIDRSKRPFRFTAEGEIFYHKTVEILKMVEQLKAVSAEMSEQIKGDLKVGIIPTLAPYLVPLFIDELKNGFPHLQIEVFELKTEDIVSLIKIGNLDCGIISTPIAAQSVNYEVLFYERFYAYVSENYPMFNQEQINLEDLKEEDIWYLEEGNCFQNQVNSICKINIQKQASQNLVYRSNSIESLRRIVENQNGVTFIPELATLNIPSELEDLIKEISGNQPVREISLVLPKNYAKERQVAALKKIILNCIPKRMHAKPESWVVDTLIHVK